MEDSYSKLLVRCTVTLILSSLISLYGLKKRSLNLSGGLAAVVVGFLLTMASGCFCAALLAFFITSSRLTKWRSKEKQKIEDEYKEGGQRNWVQVYCNGSVACVAALLYILSSGVGERPLLLSPPKDSPIDRGTLFSLACLASISCCCGDTWASEVGSVLGGAPRLITTGATVPKGTNGGITLIGTLCSFAGGLTFGIAYFVSLVMFVNFQLNPVTTLWSQTPVIWIAGLSGLVGSIVDSVLGATVQFSGYSDKLDRVVNIPVPGVKRISGRDILDNHKVNFVSSFITAIIVPVCWLCLVRL